MIGMNIKPCRVCNEVPEKGYPQSRIDKSDWICVSCSNELKAKWWAKVRLKKREAKNPILTKTTVDTIKAKIVLLSYLSDKPACMFCDQEMAHSRIVEGEGKPLTWQCHKCNDIIRAEGI